MHVYVCLYLCVFNKGDENMLASVIESTKSYVTVLTEDNKEHEITRHDMSFETYQEYYETESLFDFNPLTKSIEILDVKKGELEDFTLPEDF